MAIYGIGASYSKRDVSGQFIKKGLACIGWREKEAQPLFAILRHFKIGDIVYIKAHPPQVGLIIKAIGIVVSDNCKETTMLGKGIPIEWVWTGEERLGKFDDKYPVRNITLYEEFNLRVQKKIIQLLLSRCRRRNK